ENERLPYIKQFSASSYCGISIVPIRLLPVDMLVEAFWLFWSTPPKERVSSRETNRGLFRIADTGGLR
ncbi:MAG: hypothetical protein KAS19_04680, partial [Anaerolineales bacterium]|nr:hypothetical protein [Anaerolineales bacterium]